MDYGPSLMATFEIGDDGTNFAYKGIAVRLDPGQGGVSRGRALDGLRPRHAAARGVVDRRRVHRLERDQLQRPARDPPAGRRASSRSPTRSAPAGRTRGRPFDDPRLRGRDGRPYGPLPRSWAHYRGLYRHGDQVDPVVHGRRYRSPGDAGGRDSADSSPVFTRTFNLGPRDKTWSCRSPTCPEARLRTLASGGRCRGRGRLPRAGAGSRSNPPARPRRSGSTGNTDVEIAKPEDFDLSRGRLHDRRADQDAGAAGPSSARRPPATSWVRDGKALFVRKGKLVFDIGWVGAVASKRRVDDDRWHEVVLTYEHETGRVRLYIDGRRDGEGSCCQPEGSLANASSGSATRPPTSPSQSYFDGLIAEVRLYEQAHRARRGRRRS